MPIYSTINAEDDFRLVLQQCPYRDPTPALAFSRIVAKLTAGMNKDVFSSDTDIIKFVYFGLWSLRDPVFQGFCPSDEQTARTFETLRMSYRRHLYECTDRFLGAERCSHSLNDDTNVDDNALWHHLVHRFLPVVKAIRNTEFDRLNMDVLSSFYST